MAKQAEKREYVIEANLSLLQGEIVLPHPDDFNGEHWQMWTKAVEETDESHLNRLYCYAGLRFIEALGPAAKWAMALKPDDGEPEALRLETVQKWRGQPKRERIRAVSFIGREMNRYMQQVMDPKG